MTRQVATGVKEVTRASAWGGFSELAASMGGNPTQILAAAHVDAEMLVNPERFLPIRLLADTLAIAADRLKRKDFGLVLGQMQGSAMLGPLWIAMNNAETTRRAIEVAAEFTHLHNTALTVTLTPLPGSNLELVSSQVNMSAMPRREQYDERILSITHRTLQDVGGEKYRPQEVWLPHAPVATITAYRKVFGITPRFNQPTMGIAVDGDLLDSLRPGRSDRMREMAQTYLVEKAEAKGKKFSQSVTEMAHRMLANDTFTPERAASELGLHPRTLQRRLKEEGANFEKIKDEARKAKAEVLLAQSSIPLSQIAEMLGYADLSALSRSCKRWFGEAPRDYRARLRTKKPPPRTSRVNSLEANLRARWRAGV